MGAGINLRVVLIWLGNVEQAIQLRQDSLQGTQSCKALINRAGVFRPGLILSRARSVLLPGQWRLRRPWSTLFLCTASTL